MTGTGLDDPRQDRAEAAADAGAETVAETETQAGAAELPAGSSATCDVASPSRRGFLKAAGGAGAMTAASSMGLGSLWIGASEAQAEPHAAAIHRHASHRSHPSTPVFSPASVIARARDAYRLRKRAAQLHLRDSFVSLRGGDRHAAVPRSNGDEERYHDKRASFFKCLPQNELGEVDLDAFDRLGKALERGRPVDFARIPLSSSSVRKLANPQAAFAFDLIGVDSHATALDPAPTFESAEMAAEMAEVYWQASTRDVPFVDYQDDPMVASAARDLNAFSFRVGPTQGGEITPGTLFRQGLPGDGDGPYLSQLLLRDVPYGPTTIVQRYDLPTAGVEFMTSMAEWLAIQRGAVPVTTVGFEGTTRYLHNARGLAHYVHLDALFQAYLNGALIMLSLGPEALDPGNPYLVSGNQGGFATFGGPHVLDLVAKAARVGLEGAWFHKWRVHRRLRPEVFARRVESEQSGERSCGVHPDLLASEALSRVRWAYGTALLPQAYPEGSPTHPAYPAGHAVVAGACATVLKAFFDEDFELPNPVEASYDGSSLDPYRGEALTLGGEINKLAGNISIGRCMAGVHYRSDGNGLRVGEQQAVGILRDFSSTYHEEFDGFTLTRFDGERIRIRDGVVSAA